MQKSSLLGGFYHPLRFVECFRLNKECTKGEEIVYLSQLRCN